MCEITEIIPSKPFPRKTMEMFEFGPRIRSSNRGSIMSYNNVKMSVKRLLPNNRQFNCIIMSRGRPPMNHGFVLFLRLGSSSLKSLQHQSVLNRNFQGASEGCRTSKSTSSRLFRAFLRESFCLNLNVLLSLEEPVVSGSGCFKP